MKSWILFVAQNVFESLLRGLAIVLMVIVLVLSIPSFARVVGTGPTYSNSGVEVTSWPPGPPSHKPLPLLLAITGREVKPDRSIGWDLPLRL